LQALAQQRIEVFMIRWERVDSAQVSRDDGELCLYRQGGEFSIEVDGYELMSSRVHGSEDALAELAVARIADRAQPKVLIGGLGMGYTVASALRRLGADGQIVIAELVPAVVEWNRDLLAYLAGYPLLDHRVTVREVDVAQILQAEHRAFDAILLDVDNGPEGLTRQSNDWLYSQAGLSAALTALRLGGVLAVWSAGPSRAFTKRLRRVGFKVDEVPVRARGPHGGGHHTIWIAIRGS